MCHPVHNIDFPPIPQRNGTIFEALTTPAGDYGGGEETPSSSAAAAAAYYDALEAAASPTEVGCYDQLTPLHEASFIKARRKRDLAFVHCGTEGEIRLGSCDYLR